MEEVHEVVYINQLSKEDQEAFYKEQEEAKAQRIAEKGHACEDNRVHGYDPEMALRDYYYCAICGPEDGLLQVG